MDQNHEEYNAPYDAENEYELKLDTGESLDWASALKELESYAPPKKKKSKPAAKVPADDWLSRTQAPAPTPQPEAEEEAPVAPEVSAETPIEEPETEELDQEPDLMGEFTDVLTEVNKAINQLRRFEQAHPYLIAPNIFRVWEEGLRETSTMMTREYHRLRDDETDGMD